MAHRQFGIPSESQMIEIRDVSQIYAANDQPFLAVDRVNFSIGEGEFVCLLGHSGCGKTTLLHLLAGFLRPTDGKILIDGKEAGKPSTERSVVFQEYALFPWLTVLQNVCFGLRSLEHDKREREARAIRALQRVQLANCADRYPHELSGGQRQRVAVARSLVLRPKILLMDEPFAAVDALTRAELQTNLLSLWKESGVTILFVTHNIDEAIFLAQRVAVMRRGAIAGIRQIALRYPRFRSSTEFSAEYRAIEELLYGNSEELMEN
ncbi:MAG: ABC transporter ATP-binding protein [Candidatus Accumulibacter sp.]|jgi:NitT/TauT family transport system ATP-binding protein|nr:ABC transporter ATP-binding protein [Accumulibacter sp.]